MTQIEHISHFKVYKNIFRVCPDDWLDLKENGCFFFGAETGPTSWFDALEYCHIVKGAHLAEIHNETTRQLIEGYLESMLEVQDSFWWWVGANKLHESVSK